MSIVRISRSALAAASRSRPAGYMEHVLASASKADEHSVYMEREVFDRLVVHYSKPGAGTELKSLLSSLGIQSSPTCSCNAKARQMDDWGPDECERRMGEIVGWLREQAAARRLPFSDFAAKQLVRLAIRRARKKAAK